MLIYDTQQVFSIIGIGLCRNEQPYPKAKVNIDEVKQRFGTTVDELVLSKTDPILTIDTLIAPLSSFAKSNSKILVDISCFTHESLLILQKVIHHLGMKAVYAYCPANVYNPQTKKGEDKWLSRGIGEVRSILGYPGARNPLKSSHLIVLVGFEVERARKLIDRYEPTHLSLGYADDEIPEGAKERNKGRFNELMSAYPSAKEFTFSTLDIEKTKEAIKNQVKEFDEANPLVAPMNTKISSLALTLAAEEDERIQICYASALLYNTDEYSEASDECYLFNL